MNGSRLLRGRNLDRSENFFNHIADDANMREIVHLQAGQCGNQIGSKVRARGGGRKSGRVLSHVRRPPDGRGSNSHNQILRGDGRVEYE